MGSFAYKDVAEVEILDAEFFMKFWTIDFLLKWNFLRMNEETERPTNCIQVYFKNPQIDQQFFRVDYLEVWQDIPQFTNDSTTHFNTSAHDKVHNKNFHFICRHCFAIFCPSHTLLIITHDEYLFYTKFEYEIFPKKKKN
jgi:hypothetical protein